ncbi:ABC transporter substrate-binding protein [Fulvivirga kasyanovii]|uniref:ABC transporter substrate-binding protein n=1 Tax=Fulvivirga kasyanovii TaxID=396812 RepID=A0ABW9RQQ9_9BACT|nr:ABC transporter substrate-binding protein [Fulvivirga kasyanovii]MTI26498.1 ABC transporter substrate-binding protein [Fulvivirga kasyanovii]
MKLIIRCFAVLVYLITACSPPQEDGKSATSNAPPPVQLKYATLFSFEQVNGFKKINVKNPWDTTELYATYILVHQGDPKPEALTEKSFIVETPISSIVTLSTTHIGLLDKLEAEQALVGHSTLYYIYNKSINDRIEKGEVTEVGNAQNLNIETLIDLRPKLVMTSGHAKIHDNLKLLEKSGIPVAYNIEWMENSPLARAEWLKFMAAFFEKDAMADSIFNNIEQQYKEMKARALAVDKKPSVLAGAKYKDTWSMPGGNSYVAQLLKDANTSYYWFSGNTRGSIPISFETVIDKQLNADIWINPGGFTTLEGFISQDDRYARFDAYQHGNVYNIYGRVSDTGANDYWETGLINPHLILKDLIKIMHPEKFSDHQLLYYKKLN